jgi:hypothetical protein
MATTIVQKPLYGDADNGIIPVGQQILFTLENNSVVQNYYNVKFIAEVHVSVNTIDLSLTDTLVATFKTTPNNKGRGIFDLAPILENYVNADNLGTFSGSGSKYKGQSYSDLKHPIHIIDSYSRSRNSIRYFAVKFSVEGATTSTSIVQTLANQSVGSVQYTIFNGVLQRDNYLTLDNDDYGYDLAAANLYSANGTGNKFLTNMPTTLTAGKNDYGTISFLNFLPTTSGANPNKITYVQVKYFDASGSFTANIDYGQFWSSGGSTNLDDIFSHLLFLGIYPGNISNTNTTFRTALDANNVSYYTIAGYTSVSAPSGSGYGTPSTDIYTVNVNCPDLKGYESIRLCWLNQWGTWDYYTFNKKSTRSLQSKKTTYTQTRGTWNQNSLEIFGFEGGKKNFRVNTIEKIQMNTDYINEENSLWFEELVNSPEVYILNGYDSTEVAPYNTITNKYVEPVLLTTSSFVRKTIANDKLIQYTFEVEKNHTRKTQTV